MGGEQTDIDIVAQGLELDRWLSGDGAVGTDYRLYEVRSSVNGYWIFSGRLLESGDPLQGKFVNALNGKVLTLNKSSGVFPNITGSLYLDRTGFYTYTKEFQMITEGGDIRITEQGSTRIAE